MNCEMVISASCLSGNNRIDFWDYEKGETIFSFEKAHSKYIYFVKYFEKDLIVSGGLDKTIKLWNIDEKKIVSGFDDIHSNTILDATVVRGSQLDHSLMATFSSDGSIALIDPFVDGSDSHAVIGRKGVKKGFGEIFYHCLTSSIFFFKKGLDSSSSVFWNWHLPSNKIVETPFFSDFHRISDGSTNHRRIIRSTDIDDESIYISSTSFLSDDNIDSTPLAYRICARTMKEVKRFSISINIKPLINTQIIDSTCIRCSKNSGNLLFVGTETGHVFFFDQRKENTPLNVFKAHDDSIRDIRILSEDKIMTTSKFPNDYINVWKISEAKRLSFFGHGRTSGICFPNETKELGCYLNWKRYFLNDRKDRVLYLLEYYTVLMNDENSHEMNGIFDIVVGNRKLCCSNFLLM